MLRTIVMLGLVPMALATSTAYAQTAAPPPGTPATANAVDPASIQALKDMGAHLQSLKRFREPLHLQ